MCELIMLESLSATLHVDRKANPNKTDKGEGKPVLPKFLHVVSKAWISPFMTNVDYVVNTIDQVWKTKMNQQKYLQ